MDVKLDLTQGFNRVVDSWFHLFDSTVSTPQITPACAYPGDWDESRIAQARNNVQSSWNTLRWNQQQRPDDTMWATRYVLNKLEWDLKVQWESIYFAEPPYDDPSRSIDEIPTFVFIDNAVASVELLEPASLSLSVYAKWGNVTFNNNEAHVPVHFKVQCYDGDTPLRDEVRSFLITGEGRRWRID